MAEGSNDILENDRYFDYCWKLFDKHSIQRVQCFNYYVLMLLGVFAALGSATSTRSWEVGVFGSLVLAFLTHIFYHLERRNRALVKLSEVALLKLEARFSELGLSEAAIITEGNKLSLSSGTSYHRAFSRLVMFAYFVSFGAFIFFVIKLLCRY